MAGHHMLSPVEMPTLDHVPEFLRDVPVIELYPEFQRACLARRIPDGLHMEFGVASGSSFRQLRMLIPVNTTLYGFDWWQGIPEAWNGNAVGTFACPMPATPINSVFIKGRFEDTLRDFVNEHLFEHASYLHIDCDIYASASCVLEAFSRKIVPGTVLVFDEFYGYPDWEQHEYRAFTEYVAREGRWFEYIARDPWYRVGVVMRG